MLDCPQCSRPNPDDREACPGCGADLRHTVARDARATQPGGLRLDFLPGQVFAGRFTIIEKVGAGGMGLVYKAIDNAVGSEVCLKLILPGLAQLPSFAERLRREVRVTRKITHPNICRVHDLGRADGVLYISMEWIEGETLQQLLRQTGTLREGRALQIAEKITRALAAAHAVGVIHRDLKPANVMINSRGAVFVLDFGLASEVGAEPLSDPGMLLGTPQYMSPEQRRCETLDARSDLYSLGLILYEMLTGRRRDPAAPSSELTGSVNSLVVPILERMLGERREDRFPDATATGVALRTLADDPAISSASGMSGHSTTGQRWPRKPIAVVVLALALVGAGAVWWFWPSPQAGPEHPEARIFYSRGNEYLLEAELDDSLRYAIRSFHQALDHEPDSALILARLAEAYWHRFARDHSPAAREEAERNIDRATAIAPDVPELRHARAIGLRIEGKYESAKVELLEAVKAKPGFALAWTELGRVYMEANEYQAGLDALRRAEKLEPSLFLIQIRLGVFEEHFGEHDLAADHYRRATELKPDSTVAWNNLGAFQLRSERLEDAAQSFRASIEIEEYADARSNLGTVYYFLERYDEAVQEYRRATELAPGSAIHWGNLGDGLEAAGRAEEARDAYRRAAQQAAERALMEPLNPGATADLATYCARAEDLACARESIDHAIEMQPTNVEFLLLAAEIFSLAGDDELALDRLEKAVKLGAGAPQIQLLPGLDRLRDNPRYRRLLGEATASS